MISHTAVAELRRNDFIHPVFQGFLLPTIIGSEYNSVSLLWAIFFISDGSPPLCVCVCVVALGNRVTIIVCVCVCVVATNDGGVVDDYNDLESCSLSGWEELAVDRSVAFNWPPSVGRFFS